MIIHISGTTGSGKSYIGDILAEDFEGKLIVIDLDSITNSFQGKGYDEVNKYINEYIEKVISVYKKPIALIGYLDFVVENKPKLLKLKKHEITHKFFIKISFKKLHEQYTDRACEILRHGTSKHNLFYNKQELLNCSNFDKKLYKDYKQLSQKDIYDKIKKLFISK